MTDHTGPGSIADLRVLVVDDDADHRFTAAELMRRAGVSELTTAGDAEEAVHLAIAHQPHLILLDLAMPGRSGYEVLPELQAAAPAASIVIVSNLPRRRLVEKLLHRGAVGWVEKRVAPASFAGEILIAAALTSLVRRQIALDLPGESGASRLARRALRGVVDSADEELLATADLLVSELVTNAVLHASSAPRMEVRVSSSHIYVGVHDDDPQVPHLRTPDAERPGGRGLHLVDSLATRWGTRPDGDGKIVWFELARQASTAA